MHCQRCQKTIRNSEGITCHDCESRFHLKCVSSTKDMEGGDRGYQWKCAVCQNPAGRCSSHTQIMLNTINQISEKFELINKIQLPKLNGDLLLLKSTADAIVRQNEDILNKISQLQKTEQKKVSKSGPSSCLARNHRRIHLSLSNKTGDEEIPILSGSEKCARYKTRRRSYHLYKVLLLVNRKLRRTRTPRNKSPR
ncbi:uncharacterized protein [Epargyreus clarus]|uniref:uncharacterized protein n=1 Tax=Epargyreus clarus TaxID=520877 RepID=UPI003C2D799C